eukprot:3122018-Amphidinium_carterae.1
MSQVSKSIGEELLPNACAWLVKLDSIPVMHPVLTMWLLYAGVVRTHFHGPQLGLQFAHEDLVHCRESQPRPLRSSHHVQPFLCASHGHQSLAHQRVIVKSGQQEQPCVRLTSTSRRKKCTKLASCSEFVTGKIHSLLVALVWHMFIVFYFWLLLQCRYVVILVTIAWK